MRTVINFNRYMFWVEKNDFTSRRYQPNGKWRFELPCFIVWNVAVTVSFIKKVI